MQERKYMNKIFLAVVILITPSSNMCADSNNADKRKDFRSLTSVSTPDSRQPWEDVASAPGDLDALVVANAPSIFSVVGCSLIRASVHKRDDGQEIKKTVGFPDKKTKDS